MFHNVNGVMATVKVIANEVERSAEIVAKLTIFFSSIKVLLIAKQGRR